MPTAHVIALLVALVAVAAMIRETLAHRRTSAFPLAAVFARYFPVPAPIARLVAAPLCAGAASVLVPVALYTAAGWLRFAPTVPTAGWVLLALATVAVKMLWVAGEETIFRGALLSQVAARFGVVTAIAASAAAFAAAHLSRVATPDLLSLAVYALDGVIFGVLAVRTGSLWAPAAWHLSKNLVVWTLGWSRTLEFVGGILTAQVDGPTLWTGAAGQAGLLDVVVTAGLLGGVLAMTRPRQALPRIDPTH